MDDRRALSLAIRLKQHGKMPKRKYYLRKFTKRQLAKLPTIQGDAKEKGSVHYFTGRPCQRRHLVPRYTTTGDCMECVRMKSIMRYFKRTETAPIIDPVAANTQEMPYRTIVL